MNDLLPPLPQLSAFIAASLLLAVTPGPGVFYIVTRSIVQGRRLGLVSVAGVALGNLGNAFGASIGLAALFAVSVLAYSVVKYVGAAYLIYLGATMLLSSGDPELNLKSQKDIPTHVFREGCIVALFNPKTTLFFAAFLPQFLGPNAAPIAQSAVLGTIFVAIAGLTDGLYALAAGAVAPLLARRKGIGIAGRYVGGGAFVGLGILAALADSRGRK